MTSMRTVVYVSCAESKEIHSFRLDANSGALDPLEVVAVPGTGEPSPSNMPLAFGPGARLLYAALRSPPFPVSAFAVDPAQGTLTCLGTAPLPAPMAYIAVSADGRALMGASYKDAKLSVSRIASDGTVEAPPAQVLATPPKAHCIIPGRAGGIVYATTVDGNAILVFRIDTARGALLPAATPQVPCRPGSGPRHLVLHPTLDVLYCINETGGTLAAFAVDRGTGGLRELQYESLMPPGFSGNARAADVHVTPDGRFAYASVRSSNIIGAFRIDPQSGALGPAGSFAVEASPRGFAIDPGGRFLLCAGQTGHTLGVYAIDAESGALTLRQRVGVGGNPNWVEMLLVAPPP